MLVEPQDIRQHPQKARRDEVAPLCEQRVERGQTVFHPPAIDGGTKAHAAGDIGDVQLVEQAHKVGVVHLVEHDETGIDRLIAPLARDDGAGMAAQTRFGFE